MFRLSIRVESFRCAGSLLLLWQCENFAHRTTFQILPRSTCSRCQQKSYISKRIHTEFSKSLPQLEDFQGAHSCGKFQGHRYFSFAMTRSKLLRAENISNFATFNLFPVPAKILYLQMHWIDFRNLWRQLEDFQGGHFEWEDPAAQVFFVCNGKVKILRVENISNFATFNLFPVKAKILCLQMYWHQFLKSLAQLEDVQGRPFWLERSSSAGILLLQWQRENFAHRQHFKFCHFQHVHCASKNPISPKVFTRFLKSLPQLEDVQVGHLGGKFQVRRYFTFAMLRWKLFASTTFEILSLWTCTLCQQKSYIPKGVQPFFEILASARRCSGWACGWKVSGAQVFYFCNGKVKTFRIDNIWNFPTFNLFPVPAKILCLQRYSTNFRNLSLSSEMLRLGIWVESFRCVDILLLQWQGENFAHRQHLKFCHFEHVHCARKNPISRKVFTRFSKSLSQLEDVQGGHLGGKFQVRRYFTFTMARWKLFASTTFEIWPRSTCTLCQQKSYVSKGIYRIFEIFGSARSFSGWAFGWKVSGAQVFCFCNGKVKTFRIDNIWNFATFNLFPVPAKILCLQRYSINFRNLWLSSKMLRVGILMERFRSAGILRLQWQRENFAHGQHLKFCHIQHVHCASKNPISPKVFTRFSKSFPQLEDVQVGHLGGKFQVRRYFILQWQDENFAHEKHLKFCHVQPVHCASKNHISPKVFNRFSKSLPHLEDVECGHLGEMFQVRRCFTFAMARWKLCAWTTFEILPLSTCRLWQQKSDISKGIQPIFEIFASARRCWGWKFVWNVLGSQVFYFWNGKVKAFRIDNIWNLSTFNLFPVPAKILYLQTLSTDFRNLCLSSKMLRWTFGWKVSGAQVFYFCNGKVKILRIDNIWNFDTFNLYTVPARILYLQRYSTDFRNVRISSKIFRDGIWVESFRCAGILLLQWQSENFAHRQHLKFCHFHPLHCARKNPISPKVFNRFWKS